MSLVDGKTHVFFAETLRPLCRTLTAHAPPHSFRCHVCGSSSNTVCSPRCHPKADRLLKIPILSGIVKRGVLKNLGFDHQVLLAVVVPPQFPLNCWPGIASWGLNLVEGYAMSGTLPYSHNSTVEVNEPGCVGLPLPGVQVRISDEGRNLIKSPGQFVGYYRRPDLDAEVFTDDGSSRPAIAVERRADGLLRLPAASRSCSRYPGAVC